VVLSLEIIVTLAYLGHYTKLFVVCVYNIRIVRLSRDFRSATLCRATGNNNDNTWRPEWPSKSKTVSPFRIHDVACPAHSV